MECRDTFKSLVHDNEQLSHVKKFYFLKGALTDVAADSLHNLEISSNNYVIAWDVVCERFDNKLVLVNNYIKNVFSVPEVTKESASGIRTLLDNLVKNIRSLESLGIPVNSWDLIVIYFKVTKLDSVTVREWQERKPNNENNQSSTFGLDGQRNTFTYFSKGQSGHNHTVESRLEN